MTNSFKIVVKYRRKIIAKYRQILSFIAKWEASLITSFIAPRPWNDIRLS